MTVAVGVDQAAAHWSVSTPERSATYTTAVLTPATSLSAAARCGLLNVSVDLAWTATTSPHVTGYQIRRKTDSTSYSTVATLSGRTTTSFNDTTVNTSSKYTYLVRAIRNNWHLDSSPVTVTTPLLCL